MRTISKIEDGNTIILSVKIGEVEKINDCFPSRPAFVMNAISQLPEVLKSVNEPEMTAEELNQLETWVAEVNATLLNFVDLRPAIK
jgi:hypothetical protein